MAMITSVRAPIPVTEIPRQPRPAAAQMLVEAKPTAAESVAPPLRADAIRQMHEKSGLEHQPVQSAQVSAAAAAEAAKAAYIRARIAAGLNPLPLP